MSTKARILVIDDDMEIRDMITSLLERADYDVIAAENGKEGMKQFSSKPTDLVITDIVMPEKEGIETIQELRGKYPNVKIIAISGGGRISANDWLKLAQAFGADIILSKPFRPNELLEAISSLLN
ncbi:response regulator [candidate division KSB1 bacterium]|nr:response regulator [candidate division KSB1 bacterium]